MISLQKWENPKNLWNKIFASKGVLTQNALRLSVSSYLPSHLNIISDVPCLKEQSVCKLDIY